MMKKLGYLLLLVLIILTASCEIGLGSSVDTDPPTLEITTPPVDKIIRDSFAIGGTWSDDGTIAELSVQLNRTDIDSAPIDFTGIMEGNLREGGSGTWHADIHPFAEDGTKLVADGAYQAVVTIKDNVGRTTVQSTTFTVDNTPPVIVLTRPSTAADSKSSDTYGQTFNLEGQAADNNNVSLIEVRIYKDADCTEWVHTVPLKNVPNSINMDVAKFKSGDTENDYYKIYQNATTEGGAKEFYCQLVAYDGAVSYPIDRERTAEDELGNQIDTYYLYKDIATSILGNYKITEVYSILSGNFSEDTAARTIQPSGVIELLTNSKRSKGKFTLNPKNNPTFTVTTLTPLTKDESGKYAFTGNEIIAGGQAVIEVAPGLDGILLEEESLKVYAQKYEGGALTGSKIYPPTTKQESGTSYKFIASINRTDGFEVGKTYIFGVEGYDQSEAKNAIEPAAEAYGFMLGASGRAPQITITSPTDTNSYINQNSMTFEGTVSVELGKPEILVYVNDSEEPVATIKDNALQSVSSSASEEKYSFSWTYNKFGGTANENETVKFSFMANLAGQKSQMVDKTVYYDKDAPNISILSVSPSEEDTKKYDPDKEDGTTIPAKDSAGNLLDGYLNGTAKFNIAIVDDYDAVAEAYYKINDGTAVTIVKPARDIIEIDTTEKDAQGNDKYPDNSILKLEISTKDRAGNTDSLTKTYKIDQSTDIPVILPVDSDSVTFKATTVAGISASKGSVSINLPVSFNVYDDDGSVQEIRLRSSEAFTPDTTNPGTETIIWKGNVEDGVDEKTNGVVLTNSSFTMPEDGGYYKYQIIVKDKNGKIASTPEFILRATREAAALTGVTLTPSYCKKEDGRTFTAKITGINSMGPYILVRKILPAGSQTPKQIEFDAGEEGNPGPAVIKDENGNPKEFTTLPIEDIITVDSSMNEGDEVYYFVVDATPRASTVSPKAVLKFDNEPPEVLIKSPKSGKTGTSALYETTQFSGTAIDAKSGTVAVNYKFVKFNPEKTIEELETTGDYIALPSDTVSNGPFSIDIDFIRGITHQDGKLEEGSWYLFVKASDEAGNDSTYQSLRFDIDFDDPVIETKLEDEKLESNAEQIKTSSYVFKFKITETNAFDKDTPVVLKVKKDETELTLGSGFTVTPSAGGNAITSVNDITAGTEYKIEIPSVSFTDALYTYEIIAKDAVGKEGKVTRKVRLDTTPPAITVTSPDDFTKWQSMSSLTILGNANDASGTSGVYYVLNPNAVPVIPSADLTNEASWTALGWLKANGSSIWNISLTNVPSAASNKLYLTAVDVNGMISTVQEKTLKVDASEPTITVSKFAVGSDTLSDITGMVYLNRADGKTLTVTGTYSDTLSYADLSNFTFAVSGIPVIPASDVTFYSDAACTQVISETSVATAYWKATFSKDIQAGIFTAIGKNGAGLVKQEQEFTIKEDTGLPTITNVLLSNSYVITDASTEEKTYYVNNTDKTFTIEGSAADTNSGVKTITLSITNTASASDYGEGETKPANIINITNSGNLAVWKFENIPMQSWKKGAQATISVTDNAGNIKDEILNIIFDIEGPSTVDEIDAKQKNLYYRLGNKSNDTISDNDKDTDVGGKYSVESWCNDTSIDLRGRFEDNTGGSGVKEIYYWVTQTEPPSDLDENQIKSYIDQVILNSTGRFVLSDDETKTVYYTTSSNTTASKEITTNFRETLIGFTEGENYLLFVAEDNVGNKKIYSASAEFGGTTHTYYCFKINIDRTAPEITPTVDGTLSSNATGTLTLSGSVTDSAAGVRKLNIYVPTYKTTVDGTVGTQLQTREIEVLKTSETDGTLIACTGSTLSNGTWTYTLDGRWLAGQNDKITIKARAWDKAGETGNWTSADVASVLIDTQAPSITLDSPGDEVNKTIKLTGTGSDNNNQFTINKIQVKKIKNPDDTNVTSLTWDDVTGVTITGSDNFKVEGFNTESLTDGATYEISAVATDSAGNTATSNAVTVKVNQDSDRPVITLSNMNLLSDSNGNPALSYLKDKKLYGSVADDDGIQYLKYSLDNTTWTTVTSSSWTINLTGEGQKTLYFEVKDKAGTEFKNATDFTLPKISDTATTPTVRNAATLNFSVATAKPEISNIKYQVYNTDTSTWAAPVTSLPSNIGGKRYSQLKILLDAKSEQHISGVSGTYNGAPVTFECNDSSYADNNDHTWISDPITIGTAATLTGEQKVTIVVSDAIPGDPTTNDKEVTFKVDNTLPLITISKPVEDKQLSLAQTVSGSANETSTLYYAVSDYASDADSVQPTSWTQLQSDTSVGFYIYFDDQPSPTTPVEDHTVKFATYLTENYLNKTTAADIISGAYTTITPVYLWIKAVDECGNINYAHRKYNIDPQGERPEVAFTYPNQNDMTLGGTIRLTGTATDNNEAKYVWVQIDSDATEGFGLADLQKLFDNNYIIGEIETNTVVESITGITESTASKYGIMVEVKGSSWNLPINSRNEFNPEGDDTKTISLTIYATDENISGSTNKIYKSQPVTRTVVIDAETPYAENLELVQYSTDANPTVVARKAYTDGVSVKGKWYLTGSFKDAGSGISKIEYKNKTVIENITVNGTYSVTSSYNDSTDSNCWFKAIKEDGTDYTNGYTGNVNYKFSIPLGVTTENTVGKDSAKFKVSEKADSDPHKIEPEYYVNYDNKAPVFTVAAGNENVKLSPQVQNSNGFYTFGAIASEDKVGTVSQTGVERIAFYFTRDLSYSLNTLDSTTYAKHGTENTKDLFDVMISHSNLEDDTTYDDVKTGNMIVNYAGKVAAGTMVYQDGLYWYKLTGNISGTNVSLTTNKNIHKKGLAKVHGVIYLIDECTSSSVTLSGAPGDGNNVEVLFAVANVIDNGSEKNGSALSSTKGYGYGYYPSRSADDGDLITETFNQQSTDWIFDASINSKNLPDGPITLHLVAFDKAGNSTHWTSDSANLNFVVSNNAPRIAGMKIGTDENGNGDIDTSELISYSGLYQKGRDSSGNAMTDVTLPLQDSDTPQPALKVKGYTEVRPEIVGGNGKIYYTYSVSAYNSTTTSWAAPTEILADANKVRIGIGSTSDDVITLSRNIEIPIEHFIKPIGTNTNPIPDGINKFIFSFGDSTPGRSSTSSSSENAKLSVIMDVQLRDANAAKNWILPFYWKSDSDNSLFRQSKDNGHIELAKDWVLSDGYGTDDEYDEDPKVSGKIKIEGIASDNILLKNITVNFNKAITGFEAANTDVTLATYTNGAWTPATGHALTDSGDLPTGTSWAVSVEKATYGQLRKLPTGTFDLSGDTAKADTDEVPESSQKYGHVVHWTLYLDTANLSGIADTNLLATAKAADRGSPTWNETTSAVNYSSTTVAVTNSDVISGAVTVSGTIVSEGELSGKYQMDVVPYISKLFTAIAETAGEEFARSATGKYVVKGKDYSSNTETVRLYGFNLEAATNAITIGSSSIDLDEGDTDEDGLYYYTFDVGTSTVSGDLSVTINGVESLNNKNKNPTFTSTTNDTITAVEYNSQANGVTNNRLTDDVSLWVWDLNYFYKQTNITSPMLKMDKAGNYYMSYGYGVNQMRVNKNGTSRRVDGSFNKFHNTNVIYDDNGNIYAVATNTDRVNNDSSKFAFYTPTSTADQMPTEITATGDEYETPRDSKRHLEQVYNYNTGVYDINRVKLPRVTSYTNGGTTYIGIAYFDGNNSINPVKARFGSRNGATITGGITGNTINGSGNTAGESNDPTKTDSSAPGYHIIASDNTTIKGGQYAAVGIVPASKAGTTNNVGVVAWYDASVRRVAYSYNTNPDSPVVGNVWQTNAKYLDGKYTGWHVDLTVDDNGGIHIAYYNSAKGDLKYVYLSKYNATPSEPVTVDSYLSVGTNITINTRSESGKYVPYIYYYNSSSNQTPNSIKVAWREDMTNLRDGARADKTAGGDKDTFTGAWESMTIPTENIPVEATVCGGVPSTATGTNAYMNSTVFLGYMSDTGYEKAYIKK